MYLSQGFVTNQVSKGLVELQLENNRITEEYESENFELKNKVNKEWCFAYEQVTLRDGYPPTICGCTQQLETNPVLSY